MSEKSIYFAIDLKSFYASVECMERGLNPLTTNLVVADSSRTEKTICLAVSPSLKRYGIPGRPRLFEVVQKVREINALRRAKAPSRSLVGKSSDDNLLRESKTLALDYIIAPPRMALYIEYSTRIYDIYLKYFDPDDMHIYSIDEVFIDASKYLNTYQLSPRELVMKIIQDVLVNTGVTATAGIGTNLYLAKIAMDIMAKKSLPDKDGVRIAYLDEMSYRKELWDHRPLTDFWRVGKGYTNRLEKAGLFTMGDIARCSIGKSDEHFNEDLLYKLLGINAELLIDHAWGYEPCRISDIKAYKPSTNSICSAQVLDSPYPYEKAKMVVIEMVDSLALDLVDKGLVTDQIVLTVGYDIINISDSALANYYQGEITIDQYGRKIPKAAHGTANLKECSSSTKILTKLTLELLNRIIDKKLFVRRISISANHLVSKLTSQTTKSNKQLDLFTDYEEVKKSDELMAKELEKEYQVQKALIAIKKKYGKNAVLKGTNLQEGATTKERNDKIGGHKA